MSQGTTVILLPSRVYPGPQGTAVSYVGEKQQAAAYILANRNLQTITWSLGQLPNPQSQQNVIFVGIVTIQASLVSDPGEADWFDIYRINSAQQQIGYHNQVGNYVWLRAAVSSWTQGAINQVTASY
jgi:hypothetical protein